MSYLGSGPRGGLSGYRERSAVQLMLVPLMVLPDEAIERGLVVLGLAGRVLVYPGIELGLKRVDVPTGEIGADAFEAVVREGAQEGPQKRQRWRTGAPVSCRSRARPARARVALP